MRKIILIVLLTIYSCTFYGQQTKNEGLLNYFSSFDPQGYRRYTWFEDSTLIFEVSHHHTVTSNDSVIFSGSQVYYYTMLDLATMHAQDYLILADSALPVTNYFLQPGEGVSQMFFQKPGTTADLANSLIQVNDTILDGISLKRFSLENSENGCRSKVTVGMSCNETENLFHLIKYIDELFPGCKSRYFEYEDLASGDHVYSKLEFLRFHLTETERKVFKKWKTNLSSSWLPVTTYPVAQRFVAALRSLRQSSGLGD